MAKDLSSNNVVVILYSVAAIVFASMIIYSECRPITQDEDDNLEMKSVFSRDEIVEMAGYGEEKLSTVLITGTLLCYKKCLSDSHTHHQLYPHPISGALVGAICSNSKDKGATWAKGVSDEYGEFVIDLPSHLHAIPKLDIACSFRALQVPKNSPCYQPAYARKQTKIKLSSLGNGIRTYTTGIVAFIRKISEKSEACTTGLEDEQEMSW